MHLSRYNICISCSFVLNITAKWTWKRGLSLIWYTDKNLQQGGKDTITFKTTFKKQRQRRSSRILTFRPCLQLPVETQAWLALLFTHGYSFCCPLFKNNYMAQQKKPHPPGTLDWNNLAPHLAGFLQRSLLLKKKKKKIKPGGTSTQMGWSDFFFLKSKCQRMWNRWRFQQSFLLLGCMFYISLCSLWSHRHASRQFPTCCDVK